MSSLFPYTTLFRSEVADIGRRAASRARTMSLALSAGTHPGDDEPQFTLGDDEVELGVGIHGERAPERVPFTDADGLVELLVDPLRTELDLQIGRASCRESGEDAVGAVAAQ